MQFDKILADLGLEVVSFPHARSDGRADLEALLAALAGAGEGDAVLIHGCCHNPTGVDYTAADWAAIAGALAGSPKSFFMHPWRAGCHDHAREVVGPNIIFNQFLTRVGTHEQIIS